MYFLYIKILDLAYKDDVFLALESVGVSKASYFEANNLDNSLNNEIPLFKGFFNDIESDEKVVIITALLDEEEQASDIMKIIKASGIDMKDDDFFRMITWPVKIIK